MTCVDKVDDPPECGTVRHVGLDHPPPFTPLGNRGLRVTVSWEIYEVEVIIDQVAIQKTSLAGRGAYFGEMFTLKQGVEERGLSDVRPTREGDLGQPVARELIVPGGTEDKLGSVYLHGIGRYAKSAASRESRINRRE